MLLRIVGIVVHADDNIRGIAILDRGRNDNLLDTGIEVRCELCLGLEDACAIDNYVDALQWKVAQVLCADERYTNAIDSHRVTIVIKFCVPAPMDRIEFQQMGMHRRITDRIVDPRNFGASFQQRFQNQFADTAKTI